MTGYRRASSISCAFERALTNMMLTRRKMTARTEQMIVRTLGKGEGFFAWGSAVTSVLLEFFLHLVEFILLLSRLVFAVVR